VNKMNISETPKVRYYEADSNPTLSGDGAQIPVFIGYSGNKTPNEGIQKFKNYTACYKEVSLGGLRTVYDETETNVPTNYLLETLNDFFLEARKTDSADTTVPYVYVIDLGEATASTAKPWTDAMTLAKTRREAQVEVFVFNDTDTVKDITGIMTSAKQKIVEDSEKGNPRIAYFTINGADDETLKLVADDTQKDAYIQESRVALAEPTCFGKIIARICTTPYYIEPGYYDLRSVEPEQFNNRTEEEMNDLQASGVIFIADELAGSETHPRINLGVATSFATNEDNRPNDCLLHSRRNVDQLIREVFIILYRQLKRNETETNLSYLQSDIDVVIEEKLDAGYVMDGTAINVIESDTNPYDLKVEGAVKPVNATYLIGFSLYVEAPDNKVTASNNDNEGA